MNIRGILIPLGDDHDELRIVVHPAGGVQVERRLVGHGWLREYTWARDDGVHDADLLAVLRRAGVMIEDLICKLADVEQAAEPPQWTCECGYMNAGPICSHCGLRSFVAVDAEPTTCVICPGCQARTCRVGEVCGVCSAG